MHRIAAALFATAIALPAAAAAEAACLIVPNTGIDPADAETAAQIVCSQLRRQGEAVGDPVYDAGGRHWRVSLRPLGKKLFVAVQEVDESGRTGREGEVLLQRIEELPTAAPRLAEAVVKGKSLSETATVDSLVGEETRRYRKRGGETFFGIGFMGMVVPGTDVAPGAGMTFRWSFETADFGVLGDLRFAGGSPGDDSAAFFSAGVGGRWFLVDTNWSPYLGVGLGFTALDVQERGEFNGGLSGLGAWGEVGVEFLRFYETRLSVDLRLEAPLFELENEAETRRRYYLPVTFGVTYSF